MEIYKQILNMLDTLYMDQNQNQVANASQCELYSSAHSILLNDMDQSHVGPVVSNLRCLLT